MSSALFVSLPACEHAGTHLSLPLASAAPAVAKAVVIVAAAAALTLVQVAACHKKKCWRHSNTSQFPSHLIIIARCLGSYLRQTRACIINSMYMLALAVRLDPEPWPQLFKNRIGASTILVHRPQRYNTATRSRSKCIPCTYMDPFREHGSSFPRRHRPATSCLHHPAVGAAGVVERGPIHLTDTSKRQATLPQTNMEPEKEPGKKDSSC